MLFGLGNATPISRETKGRRHGRIAVTHAVAATDLIYLRPAGFIRTPLRTAFFFLFTAIALAFESRAQNASQLTVSVTDSRIRFAWPTQNGTVAIRQLPLHTDADLSREAHGVWNGEGNAGNAEIPRFDGASDRLFARYQLVDTMGNLVGAPQFVSDFSALPARDQSLQRPKGKKGLACIVDDSDITALGLDWAAQNIDIGGMVDWANPNPEMSFEFEGRRVGLHAGAVAALDRALKSKAEHGVAVVGILLNYVHRGTPRQSPMVHPRTDPATVPMGPAAFNTATAEGVFHYRAILHWIVERYTDPAEPHGRLTGLVIGNELQSHWLWYHLGEAEEDYVLDEYFAAVRVADLCARSVHRDFRVYLSLEHHWTLRGHAEDALREIAGVTILRGINERAKRSGDFPWNLAFHPYPESLFEPRFWNDRTAPLRLDAPRVTFRNLEVLSAFLRQPEYLWNGQPRHIALTEQGFHCRKDKDGEALQAAAFAYAWKRINAIPEIESFIYHRHVDYPGEGGLNLGLRECDNGNPNAMGRQRMIWNLFQKASTPEEDSAFSVALPIVGRTDWTNVIASRLDTSPLPNGGHDPVIYDFVAHRAQAKRENTASLDLKRVMKDAGWLANGLQQHPNPKGASVISWKVSLPAKAQQRTVLTFSALLNNPNGNGASFDVKVNGEPKWTRKIAPAATESGEIDLTNYAGREITVAFEVDALGDPAFDWATWIQPRVVSRP